MSNLVHRSLEKGSGVHYSAVLELGAGAGQHLGFVQHTWSEYFETDIRFENLQNATSGRIESQTIGVSQLRVDAEDLSEFPDAKFDRIIVTCLVAHLDNPRKSLAEIRRVLKVGGEVVIYLPSEPGFLLRTIRYLSTVQKAKRAGFQHLPFQYTEHRNHFLFLKYILMEIFEEDHYSFRSYPIRGLSWNYSLWKVFKAKRSN